MHSPPRWWDTDSWLSSLQMDPESEEPLSLYIVLKDADVDRTIEAGEHCHVDLDKDGNVVGIELF